MDRTRYVQKAPQYYAAAIYAYMRQRSGVISETAIQNFYTDEARLYEYLQKNLLFRKAVDFLEAHDLLQRITDDFGPTLYRRTESSSYAEAQGLTGFADSPVGKCFELDWDIGWIKEALQRVNDLYDELVIAPDDFESADREWAPLGLERGDPTLQEAIERIDEVIEAVRADNGYAANVPEERAYVLTSLSTGSEVLKNEQTTSFPFVRVYILEPLERVIRRFKDGVLGAIAEGARAAIVQYIKDHAVGWLEFILRHF